MDGTLRRIRGALPLVQEAKRAGYEEIYLPKENATEAALVDGIKIFGASSLKEVVEHINILAKIGGKFGEKILVQPQTEVNYKKKEKVLIFLMLGGKRS